jgi:serine/threonine protein phosphatase 1
VLYIFLGDYVDRGPSSMQVIDRLIELGTRHRVVCLKGNHEAFFLEFFSNPVSLRDWKRYGALNTLMSYGLRPPVQPRENQCMEIAGELFAAMPQSHQEFLLDLDLSLSFGDFFFVHAGARPKVALEQQLEEDLLWVREDFLLHEGMFEKMIVHGHTPVREPEIFSNRINIDTGAYATGRLTCLVLEGEDIRFL